MAAVIYLDHTSTPHAPPLNLPPSPPKAKSLFSWFPDWFPGHCGAAVEPPCPPQRRRALTFQSRQRDDSHRFPQSFVREPLSLFSSFLSLLGFFSEGRGTQQEKRQITAETHTRRHANRACVQEPPQHPSTPPTLPHSLPNKGLLVGRHSCSPRSEASCKRKKSYLFNSFFHVGQQRRGNSEFVECSFG